MRERYAFSTGALFPLETDEAFRLIKNAGFAAAEWMPQSLSDASDAAALRYAKVGLRVASIHFPLAFFAMLYTSHQSMQADGRAYALSLLKVGRDLGTKIMVVHPHRPSPPGYEALLETPVAENLLWLSDACATHGVTLAMENSPAACDSPEALLAYVRKLGHPNILPMVDTTEACEAGQDPVVFVAKAKPCHLHLSDFAGSQKHLPAGEGGIDWQGLRHTLADQAYAGMYTLEPSYKFYLDHIDEKLSRAYEFIARLMDGE